MKKITDKKKQQEQLSLLDAQVNLEDAVADILVSINKANRCITLVNEIIDLLYKDACRLQSYMLETTEKKGVEHHSKNAALRHLDLSAHRNMSSTISLLLKNQDEAGLSAIKELLIEYERE